MKKKTDRITLHKKIWCKIRYYQQLNNIDTRLFHEFFQAFAVKSGLNLHIRMIASCETHHLFEAIFKGVAKALDQALSFDERVKGVLSTKGSL